MLFLAEGPVKFGASGSADWSYSIEDRFACSVVALPDVDPELSWSPCFTVDAPAAVAL